MVYTNGIGDDASFSIFFIKSFLRFFLSSTSYYGTSTCGSDPLRSFYTQVGQCLGGVVYTIKGTTVCITCTFYFPYLKN